MWMILFFFGGIGDILVYYGGWLKIRLFLIFSKLWSEKYRQELELIDNFLLKSFGVKNF